MLTGNTGAQEPSAALVPPDAEIRNILVQRIDEFHQSVGIVVGMVGPNGRKVVSYGALEKGDSRVLNGDTVFEIGSVTKVFTSLLLSDMVQRGEVALTDPSQNTSQPASKCRSGTASRSRSKTWQLTHRVCHGCPAI
jgi:CubicO group peptidase (beta-lactamase class C family)